MSPFEILRIHFEKPFCYKWPANSRHFQPYPDISRHFQRLSAISSNCQPLFANFLMFEAISYYFPLFPAIYCHIQPVMSTNIWIFEYLNKMALKYYSYSYSCHFPSTNIFGYSFEDFWTTDFIQIIFCKFSNIQIFFNICSEPYFIIQLSIFNKKK